MPDEISARMPDRMSDRMWLYSSDIMPDDAINTKEMGCGCDCHSMELRFLLSGRILEIWTVD
jgi:hypothetical protein